MGKASFWNSFKINVASFFGVLGCLFCVLQWGWLFATYSSMLKYAVNIIQPTEQAPVDVRPQEFINPAASVSGPSVFVVFLGIILMIVAIALVVYSFSKVPKITKKTSHQIIEQTVQFTAPVVSKIQHKSNTKKFRIDITPKIIALLKFILVILPLILCLVSSSLSERFVDYKITAYVGLFLFIASFIFFAIQYLLMYLFKTKDE